MKERILADEDSRSRVSIPRVLARGLRRRCPHCGEAPLFEHWFRLHKQCSVCGLVFEQRPGDTWAFWLFGDRLFIGLMLLIVVLGFRSKTYEMGLAFFCAFAAPLVYTMPHRYGVCIGLDYLSRVYWGDPSDIPEAPRPGANPS